jgi:hypothetical protein
LASTVIQAFNEFQRDMVNLLSDTSDNARRSRDWLLDQIKNFDSKEDSFPYLYSDINIHFGSFARRTKIRELDDIDLMIGIKANGATYSELLTTIEITVPDEEKRLRNLCFDYTNKLNSRKVINKFVSMFSDIPQYSKAEIKRNQEAATLKLNTYSWNFDIVPCFMTKEDTYGKSYYLIPDGNGNWKKTDPRIDRERIKDINKKHSGNVLNVIRIMKYWNKRATMPTIPSYLLETIILNYYDNKSTEASRFVDMEMPGVLQFIQTEIMGVINDPKDIQGDINSLGYFERFKISQRAELDKNKAVEARSLEGDKNMRGSINKWREIFGDSFPKFSE